MMKIVMLSNVFSTFDSSVVDWCSMVQDTAKCMMTAMDWYTSGGRCQAEEAKLC